VCSKNTWPELFIKNADTFIITATSEASSDFAVNFHDYIELKKYFYFNRHFSPFGRADLASFAIFFLI